MVSWSLFLLMVAFVAAVMGFTTMASAAALSRAGAVHPVSTGVCDFLVLRLSPQGLAGGLGVSRSGISPGRFMFV